MKTLSEEAIESITERLSSLDTLYFPRAVESVPTTRYQRRTLLHDLLSRDAVVFLERYGSEMTSEELGEFDALGDDYEVNWHLKNLRSKINPTSEELKSRSVTVKNRRSAYLNKLISDGQYFSDDAMREREPYLHHEFVGKFEDASGRNMARPGERWSETLMRRCEEAVLVDKIRTEQQRLGVDERDWIGNERRQEEEQEEEVESEEEEEEDEMDENKANGKSSSSEVLMGRPNETSGVKSSSGEQDPISTLSEEEKQDMKDQFTNIMQQKFLSGEDHEHLDYSKIDNDVTLDDHWMREVNQDAEEKYFAED
ncbi:hypothetical protein ACFE04_012439 [Oxalis oulophora]